MLALDEPRIYAHGSRPKRAVSFDIHRPRGSGFIGIDAVIPESMLGDILRVLGLSPEIEAKQEPTPE